MQVELDGEVALAQQQVIAFHRLLVGAEVLLRALPASGGQRIKRIVEPICWPQQVDVLVRPVLAYVVEGGGHDRTLQQKQRNSGRVERICCGGGHPVQHQHAHDRGGQRSSCRAARGTHAPERFSTERMVRKRIEMSSHNVQFSM